ncbi:lipoprotein [Lysinibacillus sp. 38-6]|uniref:lipoprotein n=1 Tax=Lysinibacillus sp. 38-6 TaxID=3385991 RepID=UPI003908A35D
MKKLLTVLFALLLLTACNKPSILSISKIDNVPNEVQEVIDNKYTLQKINVDKNTFYISYQSQGIVTTDLETQGNTLIIKLDVANQLDFDIAQHVYKITKDSNIDTIDVHINGTSTTIDHVTALLGSY